MKIDSKLFKMVLAHAKRVVDGKSTMPALRGVRLAVLGGLLRLDATDLGTWLTLTAPVGGELPPVLVDLAKVAVVLDAKGKRGASGTVDLNVEWKSAPAPSRCKTPHPERPSLLCDESPGHDGKHSGYESCAGRLEWDGPSIELPKAPDEPVLHVEVGARAFTLAATRADQFPKVPDVGAERQVVSYDSERLRDALVYVVPAVGLDETRRHLCGVWFKDAEVFALDGHRLHVVGDMPRLDGDVFVPAKTARALASLLVDAEGEIALTVHHPRPNGRAAGCVAKGLCGAEAGNRVCELRRAHRLPHKDLRDNATWTKPPAERDGATSWRVALRGGATAELRSEWKNIAPPPVEQIVPDPERAAVRVEVERAPLSEAFALAGKVSARGVTRVSVNGAFAVGAASDDGGEVVEKVPAKIAGELEAGVAAAYMVDALAGLPEKVVVTNEGDALSPFRIDGVGGGRRFAVVMPMRL